MRSTVATELVRRHRLGRTSRISAGLALGGPRSYLLLTMKRALVLVGALVACRKEPATSFGPTPDASSEALAGDTPASRPSALLAARCHATAPGISLDDGGGFEDLDLGDAVAHGDGYAVGVIHRAPTGLVPAVVFVGRNVDDPKVVDLGPTVGDAPPPRLASCQKGLLAAAFRLPDARSVVSNGPRATRDLGLYSVDRRLPPQLLLSIPQHRDDSLASDLACSGNAGMAVWDETIAAMPGLAPRGVVRGATFELGAHDAEVRDLSPPESDAESPRVLSNGAGFFVFWLARRVEATNPSDSAPGALPVHAAPLEQASSSEAVGEARAYGWLEMVALNATGSAAGPVRRLTPVSGHGSAYDVQLIVDGAKHGIVAALRDDAELVDGAGGTLLQVRAWDDGVEAPQVVPIDGLGRGAPAFVEGSPAPWLTWVGPREGMRLLPLDPAGGVVGPPSAEDRLDDARLLLVLRPGADGRVLAAAPRDKIAQLQVFNCQR
jgi:hypothetical protein